MVDRTAAGSYAAREKGGAVERCTGGSMTLIGTSGSFVLTISRSFLLAYLSC